LKQNKNIEELFRDGFDSFEPNVPSNAWNAINNNLSNVGATSVASAKGLSFGITMAVASLVGLVGTHSVLQYQRTHKDDSTVQVVVNKYDSTKQDQTANYEETVDAIAQKDEVVRTNIEEIKRASVVSENQKEAAKTVLEETLDNLVVSSELPINNTKTKEASSLEIEKRNNALIEANRIDPDKNSSSNSLLENVEKETKSSASKSTSIQGEASKIVRIPNVFTPNGDYRNDEFFIDTEGMKDFYVRIIDEKGNTIFESTDASFRWNGEDQFNNNVPEGNYYCVIKALGMDGVSYSKTSLLYVKR
jgi:gliding motility-associated-like protein